MADYNVRLIEAETAYDLGITFDNCWYDIPVKTREYMIATRLARKWLEYLTSDDMMRSHARTR